MKIYYVLKNEYNQINIIINDNRIIHNIKDLKSNNIKSIKFNINENNDFLSIELNENETMRSYLMEFDEWDADLRGSQG